MIRSSSPPARVVEECDYFDRQPFAPDATAPRDRWLQLPESSNPSQVANLLRPLVRPGDLIVDPFVGAGSTIVAAQQLGHRSLGIEQHPAAFAGAYAKAALSVDDADEIDEMAARATADVDLISLVARPVRDAVAAAVIAAHASAVLSGAAAGGLERRLRAISADLRATHVRVPAAVAWGDSGAAAAYRSIDGNAPVVVFTSPPHIASRRRTDDAFVRASADADHALHMRGMSAMETTYPAVHEAPLDRYAGRIRRAILRAAASGGAVRFALIEFESTPTHPAMGQQVAMLCEECGLPVREIRVLYTSDPTTGEPRSGGVVVATGTAER